MEITYNTTKIQYNTEVISWEGITNANNASIYACKDLPAEISVDITGNFGGGTITIKGGINVANTILKQLSNTSASVTANSFFTILDKPLYIQPVLTGGTNSNVSIYMAIKYMFN